MKRNVINLFMWGYQQHFQISIQVTAESLFNEIDKRLKPKTFLLGVLVDHRDERHPICLEPEDCGYSVKPFQEITLLASELEKVDEEKNIFHSHPIAQENHNNRISNKAYIEAISKILKKEDLYGDTEKFISYPCYVEGYLVFVVLEINKEGLSQHYSLTKDRIQDRYKISRSFIESNIDTFLKECSNALKDPNRGIGAIERQTSELLTESAKQFMYTVSNVGNNFDGLHGLYDACNIISSLKYEGAEGLGTLVIAKKGHPNIKITLELENPILIRDYRKVRKFLELSDNDSIIISDSTLIYGLGEIRGRYNPKSESLFTINFTKHYQWTLHHDNNPLMSVSYREPRLPSEKIDRDKFFSDFRRIFAGINNEQIDQLWDITLEATLQKHGTMLIITDSAKQESKRLGNQCFKIKPLKTEKNFVQQITSIDGGILVDRDSTCHAIGVILDGIATDKGDSSRGSRYNSAIRYYEYMGVQSPTAIVIISEDGMINIVPNLRPQIKHSVIIDSIKKLSELSLENELSRKDFNHLMSFFKSVEFYLSQEECVKINDIRKKVEQNESDVESVRIVYNDLKPNEEMNESYYIKE